MGVVPSYSSSVHTVSHYISWSCHIDTDASCRPKLRCDNLSFLNPAAVLTRVTVAGLVGVGSDLACAEAVLPPVVHILIFFRVVVFQHLQIRRFCLGDFALYGLRFHTRDVGWCEYFLCKKLYTGSKVLSHWLGMLYTRSIAPSHGLGMTGDAAIERRFAVHLQVSLDIEHIEG